MKNVIFTYDTIQNGERSEASAMILVEDGPGHFNLPLVERTTPRQGIF